MSRQDLFLRTQTALDGSVPWGHHEGIRFTTKGFRNTGRYALSGAMQAAYEAGVLADIEHIRIVNDARPAKELTDS